ncbi:Ppx/GppA phosphatase family protein [Taylorella asinigenitalis]|uniref:Exopolyphosphatase n=1 Tax=Taylorella asinigenitalis (strain MCE3) TaxID=1008459 RepID=G4QBI2_TAYAM|nr:Ppx/GppA phosphatase family protein [Taylorella asinigenitalis]AEP36960.1 Exopolyphosphatase [Taylorella asinigenitalis MCE3]
MNSASLLAAVDLGSNSFRLSVGRVVELSNGIRQIYSIDRLKETVRLAAGLNENLVLDDIAISRAEAVLKMFGERIKDFPPQNVRAVATNTFRVAKNANKLLQVSEAALGFPIEVISGQEEARLIFSGVAHELPPSKENRLVIDIGGGSTEFIIGKGLEPQIMTSLHMGCVSFSKAFFPKRELSEKAFAQAELAASKEIEVIRKSYTSIGWKQAFGSSGTAKALVAVLEDTGYSEKGITLEGMLKLRKTMIKYGMNYSSHVLGLKTDRTEVLPAGLSIMIAIFKSLGIKQMHQGEGALRVGVLYDMLGRQADTDKRDETVDLFMHRYHIDKRQAYRVESLALNLFDDMGEGSEEDRKYLTWAAKLHEIGLSISQSSYHKHTAYVLENADLPGFSKDEQKNLALISLMHHGSLNKVDLDTLDASKIRAILSLRLAVLFSRSRQDLGLREIQLTHKKEKSFVLEVPKDWISNHPLTKYSLNLEADQWMNAGYNLKIKGY